MTDQPASLAEALALLQTRLPDIKKASNAQYGKYADLADVSKALLPVMGELGLSFTAKPTWVVRGDGAREFVLAYRLSHVSGQWDEGEYPLGTNVTSHQAIGSAITYGRRYCLCAITGAVADEDDDGQAASAPAVKRQQRPKPPERAPDALPRNRDGAISRSQATDEELHAAGNMTDTQLRDHNRLERDVKGTGPQGTERLAATPDDDLWYQPSATTLTVPQAARPIDSRIVRHFERFGITDKDVRLGYTATLAGRSDALTSTKDLTAMEAMTVLQKLSACKDRAAFEELMGETP